jgi:hypothetical protein
MKLHDLLLDRHAGGIERRHDGSIAVDETLMEHEVDRATLMT